MVVNITFSLNSVWVETDFMANMLNSVCFEKDFMANIEISIKLIEKKNAGLKATQTQNTSNY